MSKKPDNVKFNEELQAYDAKITPYPTNLGAPKIEIDDISNWKNKTLSKVNHQLEANFEALKKEYQTLINQYEDNKLIFGAKFNFEPIVGKDYYLYEKEDKSTFLSILKPEECRFKFLGSFLLNASQVWERVSND